MDSLPIGEEDQANNLVNRTKQNKEMNITDFFKQSRHYFIMTEGGTPIYSRYGDEIENCGILATFSAIITKFTIFNTDANFAEKLNYISNDKTTIVFLKKGKIFFIALSKANDSISLLYSQLEMLYSQLLSIITSQRMRVLEEKPSSCQTALQDTEQLFEQIIDYTSKTLVSLLSAYQVLPIENRNKLNDICSQHLGKALICSLFSANANEVIAISKTNLIDISQNDILLIQNLILHSDGLRSTESWVPICLPGISDEGFVQLYTNFTTDENIGVIFVTESQDNSFFLTFINESRKIIDEINDKGLMENVKKSREIRSLGNPEESKEVTEEVLDDFMKLLLSDTNKDFTVVESDKEQGNLLTESLTESITSEENDEISRSSTFSGGLQNANAQPKKTRRSGTFTASVYKPRKDDPIQKIKYAIIKHKIHNQFFSVNFGPYSKITPEEEYVNRAYGKLYDMYNSQDDTTINLNNFFHFEQDSKYIHAIFTNENFILMATFNLFKKNDEVYNICRDLLKLLRSYESNFFINIK